MKKTRVSIRKNIYWGALLVSLLPFAFFAVMVHQRAIDVLEKKVTQNLTIIADNKVQNIHEYFQDLEDGIASIANHPTVVRAVNAPVSGSSPEKSGGGIRAGGTDGLKAVIGHYRTYMDFSDLFLVGRNGIVVFSTKGQDNLGADLTTESEAKTALGEIFLKTATLLEPVIVDHNSSSSSNQHTFYMATPIWDAGEFIGLVIIRLIPDGLRSIIDDTRGLGRTGETLVASLEGNNAVFMAYPRNVPYGTAQKRIHLGESLGVPVQKAIQGSRGVGVALGYEGKKILAAWRYLPELGWGMVVKMDIREVFAPVFGFRNIFLVMSALTITAVLILAYILTNSITGPIRRLSEGMTAVGRGGMRQHIVVETADEVGELARSFNTMIDNLKQVTASREELNKAYSDLKQAQTQLLQSEKLASIGQLAAGVAHEINNPVGFISNNMEMLGQYIADYGKVLRMVENLKTAIEQENLEKARSMVVEMTKFEKEINLDYIINDINNLLQHNQRGLERIQKIVLDLRTFAREDKDAIDLVKIEEIIDSILSIVHNELKYKAELKKSYGDTPLVWCNPQRLGQVFINLLVNAVQAIEEKGVIEIKTYRQGENIFVDIIDTGKGIEEKNLRKIFDPFFTTKPVGQGTGLGLSVSYEIIKKHGGEIKVKSTVGEGTIFTVKLPINNEGRS